jgi:hypothetical protein
MLTEYVRRIVAVAPPLNEEQAARLAALLRPVKEPEDDGRVRRSPR